MHRSFTITLPATTNYYNLYTLMLVQTGAVPTDGILPDRGAVLDITAAPTNGANTIFVSDRNSANSVGEPLIPSQTFHREANRNSICFRDFTVAGDAASQGIIVDIECL